MTLPLLVDLSPWGVLVANVAACAAIHTGTGYVVHRIPLDRLQRDGWLLAPRSFERDGALYERLRIRRWKDRLPEAGALFAGGVSKRHLAGDLERFAAETRRAEYGHWLAMACAPVFALWNPLAGLVLMSTYCVVVNVPFIAIQRYNRQRTQRILARRAGSSQVEGKGAVTPPTRLARTPRPF
jgi:glycosyl-4,4'-diaponeurosporenoate acyltransferase